MRSGRLFVAGVLLSVAVGAATGGGGTEPTEDPSGTAPAVHADAAEVEQALLDATRAFLYGDLVAARAAMDRMEAGCSRLSSEANPEIPRRVITYDQAFHLALDTSREWAARKDIGESFKQFVWIQRGCRHCHKLSRDHGLPAPRDVTPETADSSRPR